MVIVLTSGSSGLALSPGQRHLVVFFHKTLNFHSASLHPNTSKLYAGGYPVLDLYPIQRE